ncbi:MAG: 30S ribosome-binding factor RbfA [Deltaproteobacteria bacterium]|nr:30S ribosome-binding factor RbfA [Deltaproteobacteria bacterium]MBW2253208.1 30S ribosome-binding factor RbfA [Deltaproteobacteria bacterium]
MGGYRVERVAEMIHRELAQRLLVEVKDPRLVPISITQVQVTRDLSRATVDFMPLGGGEVSEDLRQALDDAARTLRGPIGRALRLHHSPELVFRHDTHTEEAFRVTRILEELAAAQEPGGEE